MDYRKASESEIKQKMENLRKQQSAVPGPSQVRDIPVGAGRPLDDLSKVQTTDVIGKGGESDLRK